MLRTRLNFTLIITLIALITLVLINQIGAGTAVAGDEGIRPLIQAEQPMSAAQNQAQDLALLDARVAEYTAGDRAEVFSVFPVSEKVFPPEFPQCADGYCYQVDIYNFDKNAAVTVVVHTNSAKVLDVLYLSNSHPPINSRLYNLAVEIIRTDYDVESALGFVPDANQIRLMEGNHMETECDGRHLCAGATFYVDSGTVWVLVDLNTEKIAKIWWTDRILEPEYQIYTHLSPEDCQDAGSVSQDGWAFDYATTSNDGLNMTNIAYNGNAVATSIKQVEWHADYGASGYVDAVGCGPSGGGFQIYPYGDTQVIDLYEDETYVGFEVVRDFRMGNWGGSCGYRYEQRFQFFTDGRWRVVSGAFGKGCGTNATYRTVVRIDIAVDGDTNDTFSVWDGASWVDQAIEAWWLQSAPYTTEGYRYRVMDQSGSGFYIEPGQGQFGDEGIGDNAYLYATAYHLDEGGNGLNNIGACCLNDHQQGPHFFVNNEDIDNENIVLWYVPQSDTDASAPDYYCWTVSGEPNPETYPCYSGPMFVPIDSCVAGTAVAPIPTVAAAANGMDVELNWSDDAANTGGYEVWRGISPYFNPGGVVLGTVKVYDGTDTSFTDFGRLGDPNYNYTYVVRAKDCSGSSTADSIRVGEFDYSVLMGTP